MLWLWSDQALPLCLTIDKELVRLRKDLTATRHLTMRLSVSLLLLNTVGVSVSLLVMVL